VHGSYSKVYPERETLLYAVPESNQPIVSGEVGNFLSLKDLLRVIWQRLWVIILVAALFAGVAVGYNLSQTPVYQASIKILVGQEPGSSSSATLAGDVYALQDLVPTVAEALHSLPVAEAASEEMGPPSTPQAILGNMSVEPVEATQFILVEYQDTDPQRAQEAANTVGEVFSEQISERGLSSSSLAATVWEPAVEPQAPVSPKTSRNGFLALVLGMMVGITLAFLLEHLDDRWRSPEDAEQVSGVPTFGVVRTFNVPKARQGGI
jgi:capsular polysaccharide biosynthesis protein